MVGVEPSRATKFAKAGQIDRYGNGAFHPNGWRAFFIAVDSRKGRHTMPSVRQEVCRCGHAGHRHLPKLVRYHEWVGFLPGLGTCGAPGCSCEKFAFAHWAAGQGKAKKPKRIPKMQRRGATRLAKQGASGPHFSFSKLSV